MQRAHMNICIAGPQAPLPGRTAGLHLEPPVPAPMSTTTGIAVGLVLCLALVGIDFQPTANCQSALSLPPVPRPPTRSFRPSSTRVGSENRHRESGGVRRREKGRSGRDRGDCVESRVDSVPPPPPARQPWAGRAGTCARCLPAPAVRTAAAAADGAPSPPTPTPTPGVSCTLRMRMLILFTIPYTQMQPTTD